MDSKPKKFVSSRIRQKQQNNKEDNKKNNDKRDNRKKYDNNRNNNRGEYKRKAVVKLSNLPIDITENELRNLVKEWGYIGNINVQYYGENKDIVCSYIDFYNDYEADYFVKALNKTPFDNLIMVVERKR